MLKKEFKQLKSLWSSSKASVAACDELEMAITRIQLRYPGEKLSDDDFESKFKLHESQVDVTSLPLFSLLSLLLLL